MKSFTLSALALMTLSLAPALSHADSFTGRHHHDSASTSEYGQHGYEHRVPTHDVMQKRMVAMHSARAEILDRSDACLERAVTVDAAKACIRVERAETKALHDRMKAQMAERAQKRAAKHGAHGLAPADMPDHR